MKGVLGGNISRLTSKIGNERLFQRKTFNFQYFNKKTEASRGPGFYS